MVAGSEIDSLLVRLAELGRSLESCPDWPGEQLRLLGEAGVLGSVIPAAWGGSEIGQRPLIHLYVRLAEACLTCAFILTQRNGACARIAASDNTLLKGELLPRLARGEIFATVGISHLTTSRQHLRGPAVQALEAGDDFVLRGEVPWVTGAAQADYIVTGGGLPDGKQLLALLPARTPGVCVRPAERLLALTASQTAAVELKDVRIERRWLLAGPVERVMQSGGGTGAGAGTGSLVTSALALGHSQGAIRQLTSEAIERTDLVEIAGALRDECARLEDDIHNAPARGISSDAIRVRANSLVLRSTQALLAASKGAGFVAGHPAERAVREALFFLVWSCPQPVLAAALREFSGTA